MSKNSIETIKCPKCGTKSQFTVWQSVNTDLDPEMKEAVKNLSIFRFTCPKCGYSSPVDYDILYHQMRDRIMIQYVESDEAAEKVKKIFSGKNLPKEVKGFFSDLMQDDYLIRIVRSPNELREKIEIFDAGLDDRIIEIYKTILLVNVSNHFPDAKNFEMFFLQTEQKKLIQIFADGKPAGTTEFNDELYSELQKEFGAVLPEIRKDDPVINRDYAFRSFALVADKSK